MKKQIIKLLCSCLMVLSGLTSYAYDFQVDGINYNIASLSNLTCQVAEGSRAQYSGDIVIPSQVVYNNKTLKVIGIDNFAFSGCSYLKSCIIGDNIKSIGIFAFDNCSALQSIELPNSVVEIGESAFANCSALQSIELSDSVVEIGESAFANCSALQSIVLPNSITLLGERAFSGCSALQSVKISNSITEIEFQTFSSCKSLEFIEMPNSIQVIGNQAFYNCSALKSIILSNSVTTIGSEAFSYCKSLQAIEIPNSVTNIGYCAFMNCSTLEEIRLSESLTEIKYGTFYDCESLKSITIPASVKTIHQNTNSGNKSYGTFAGCSNFKHLIINYNPNKLLFKYQSSYSNPHIDAWTNDLETIFIDRELGYEAISITSGNVSTVYPSLNITYLYYLKELTLGQHIKNVCVEISNAHNLTKIVSYAPVPPAIPEATNNQYMNVEVVVPTGSLEAYQNAEIWKNFWNIREISDVETGIIDIISEAPKYEVARFSLRGQKVSGDYKGLVIVKYSDGTSRKVINK